MGATLAFYIVFKDIGYGRAHDSQEREREKVGERKKKKSRS